MTWYARIFDTDTKEIRYESLLTTKKTEAHELMLAKLADGEFERRSAKDITLGQAFDEYLASLDAKGSNAGTIETSRNALESVKSLRGAYLSELDRKSLLDAFTASCGGCASTTYNMKRTFVKTAIKYAITLHELDIRNPADIIRPRKVVKAERSFWTPEQVERIISLAPNPRYRLLWSLMAFAGLRIREAIKVKPEDVRDGFIHVVGKGDKYAKVPVSSRMAEEMERYGGAWDLTGIDPRNKVLHRTAAQAIPEGFEGKAFNHRFRHSFASNLIRKGCNPTSVQRLLRHSQIGTTLGTYSHLFEEDLKEDIEKMFKK